MMNPAATVVLAASLTLAGCAASTHATQPSQLGAPHASADMLAVVDQPGPIEVESIVSTTWAVPRSGLINLDAPKAKAAGLRDGDEPIQVYFHVVRHPRFGTFIIDTGVERALRDAPGKAAVRGLVSTYLHTEKMGFEEPLGDWICRAARADPRRLLHAPAPRSRQRRARPAEEHAALRGARRDDGARLPQPVHAGQPSTARSTGCPR